MPVKLYLATESRGGLSFNLLHKECLNRIQMKTHCPEHGEIPRADTVRGFEWSKGQYVVIDEEDFEKVPLKTVRAIEIAQSWPDIKLGGGMEVRAIMDEAGAEM